MAISQAKILQLLRSDVKDSKGAALEALEGAAANLFGDLSYDGAPLVVRYHTNKGEADDEVKSLFVVFHQNADGRTGYTVFDNSSEAEAALEELKEEVADIIGIPGLDGADGKDGKDALADALSGTTYAKNGKDGENGETIVAALEALDDAIVANKVASADETIVITTAATGTDLSVNVDGLTIVKATEGDNKGKISTAVKIQYVASVPATEDTEAVPAHIALMDNANTELSTVAVSDLIGNGVLDHSSYDANTGMLSLFFKQADGTMKEEKIDLHEMLDINDMMVAEDSTDYLKVELDGDASESGKSQAVFSVLKGTVAKPAMPGSPEVSHLATAEEAAAFNEAHAEEIEAGTVTAMQEGDKVIDKPAVPASEAVEAVVGVATAEDVSEAIADEVALLEEEIKDLQADSISGVVVNGLTAVVEDNVASVVINGDDIEVASAYTEVEYAEEFAEKEGVAAVAADDTVAEAFAKVEGTVKVLVDEVLDNEEVTEKAIEALAEAAGLLDADGVISYVGHPTDPILSAATSLNDADLLLAKAIRANSTKIEAEEGNSEVLGVDVKPATDSETGAVSYKLDVNYDFGSFTL